MRNIIALGIIALLSTACAKEFRGSDVPRAPSREQPTIHEVAPENVTPSDSHVAEEKPPQPTRYTLIVSDQVFKGWEQTFSENRRSVILSNRSTGCTTLVDTEGTDARPHNVVVVKVVNAIFPDAFVVPPEDQPGDTPTTAVFIDVENDRLGQALIRNIPDGGPYHFLIVAVCPSRNSDLLDHSFELVSEGLRVLMS